MKRSHAALMGIVMLLPACGGPSGEVRTVLVDYNHDEFASFMIANFPKALTVAQGDRVVFKQIWTGEPHTVTGGSAVDEAIESIEPFLRFIDVYDAALAAGVELPDTAAAEDTSMAELFEMADADAAHGERLRAAYDDMRSIDESLPEADSDAPFSGVVETVITATEEPDIELPWGFVQGPDGQKVAQNAAQPCYLGSGLPPEDPDEPCTEAQQQQPVFDGTASYYNSGIIPYEGPNGNTFEVQLANDIEPGTYAFYCAVHGAGQRTMIEVKPRGAKVPSQEAVSRQAREEITTFSKPLEEAFRAAQRDALPVRGQPTRGPFAGVWNEFGGSVNEFVPKTIRTRVGRPVTWKVMGPWSHTISFSVPEYFPIIRFARDGEVSQNPKMVQPAGGSPEIPRGQGPPEPIKIDAGTYDGNGFMSSGLFAGMPYAEYTLRFSRPGTYKYACMIHPPMVGTVVVSR